MFVTVHGASIRYRRWAIDYQTIFLEGCCSANKNKKLQTLFISFQTGAAQKRPDDFERVSVGFDVT